jgi:hypothetical protein
MACICYKMSTGQQSHPITWVTLGAYSHTEAGFHEALKHEAQLIDSAFATRIIRMRDDDCKMIWAVQRCIPWKCCGSENTHKKISASNARVPFPK